MGVSGYGDHDEPLYTQAPRTRADLQEASDYAKKVGNRRVGSSSARTQATAAGKVWDGLSWYETDTGFTWLRANGSWLLVDGRRCALQLNGPRNTGANGGDLAWDTVLSDPSNMRDGVGIKALWTGRYHVQARAALQGNIASSDRVSMDCLDAGGTGYVFSRIAQWGLPGDYAMQLVDEITLNAGTTIRFRMAWTGSSGARQFSYGGDDVRARLVMRYLGPA